MCLQLSEYIIKTKLLLSKLVSGCYCSHKHSTVQLTKSDFKLITESSQGSRDHQVSKRIKIQLFWSTKHICSHSSNLFFLNSICNLFVSHASLCFLLLFSPEHSVLCCMQLAESHHLGWWCLQRAVNSLRDLIGQLVHWLFRAPQRALKGTVHYK